MKKKSFIIIKLKKNKTFSLNLIVKRFPSNQFLLRLVEKRCHFFPIFHCHTGRNTTFHHRIVAQLWNSYVDCVAYVIFGRASIETKIITYWIYIVKLNSRCCVNLKIVDSRRKFSISASCSWNICCNPSNFLTVASYFSMSCCFKSFSSFFTPTGTWTEIWESFAVSRIIRNGDRFRRTSFFLGRPFGLLASCIRRLWRRNLKFLLPTYSQTSHLNSRRFSEWNSLMCRAKTCLMYDLLHTGQIFLGSTKYISVINIISSSVEFVSSSVSTSTSTSTPTAGTSAIIHSIFN